MLINNKNQNNNSIDYIISFDFLKFKEYISNTKSIIRILNKDYNNPSINIIFYNIKLNHLADQFFLDFLKFKDEILLEKNISIFCTNERNILEANNNIICKKKLLNTKKHIFLLHPNFIFKKIFKNKIDTIIQDLENNKEINWVNFLIDLEDEINVDKYKLANTSFVKKTLYHYKPCFSPKIFPSLVKKETAEIFFKNYKNFDKYSFDDHIDIDEKKQASYGFYLLLPINQNPNIKYLEKNKYEFDNDAPLISGDFNLWKFESMISDEKKDNIYSYRVNSLNFKNHFKIIYKQNEINFKLLKNIQPEQSQSYYSSYGEDPNGYPYIILEKSNFLSEENIIFFDVKTKHLFIKRITLNNKIKDLCLFFENKEIENKIPLNLFYLLETLNDKESEEKYKNFLQYSNFSKNFYGYIEDKTFYSKIFNEIKNYEYKSSIPKIVHLTFGFAYNAEFNFFNYLSIISIVNKIKPYKILFYYQNEIHGEWWERAKKFVTLIKIKNANYFQNNQINHFAHVSDIVRLEALRYSGGIYLDLDVIVNKSFDQILNHNFVMAIQDTVVTEDKKYAFDRDVYGLCNAVMLSKKNSIFSEEYIKKYKFFDKIKQKNWDYFSVVLPYKMSKTLKNEITILEDGNFFPFYWGDVKNKIFGENIFDFVKLKNSFCFHLWETGKSNGCNEKNFEFLKKINISYILNNKNNFTKMIESNNFFENHKESSISLLFLTHNNFFKTKNGLDSYLKYIDRKDIKEIIILDNGSKDESLIRYLNEIKKHKKVHVIFESKNLGVAGGRDALFKKATGEIIFSLDSDSFIYNDKFFDEGKEFLSDKIIGICGPIGAVFKDIQKPGNHKDYSQFDDGRIIDTITGCGQIFKRSLLNDISMDLNYSPYWFEDTDFCFQAASLGYLMYKFKTNNYYHSWGGSGDKLFGNNLFLIKHEYFKNKWELQFNLLKAKE
jgi:GT2 family glycosyltransferase